MYKNRTLDVDEGRPLLEDIVVGKDVLELVSSAMYIDPLTVYREYVQNAADAIDDARRDGLFKKVSLDGSMLPSIPKRAPCGSGTTWNTAWVPTYRLIVGPVPTEN